MLYTFQKSYLLHYLIGLGNKPMKQILISLWPFINYYLGNIFCIIASSKRCIVYLSFKTLFMYPNNVCDKSGTFQKKYIALLVSVFTQLKTEFQQMFLLSSKQIRKCIHCYFVNQSIPNLVLDLDLYSEQHTSICWMWFCLKSKKHVTCKHLTYYNLSWEQEYSVPVFFCLFIHHYLSRGLLGPLAKFQIYYSQTKRNRIIAFPNNWMEFYLVCSF